MDWTPWLIVIPARLKATRLPRKPLVDLGGKPLIVRVFERLAPLQSKGAEIVVATDDQEVVDACALYHVPTAMTRADHKSGTDRCAELALTRSQPYVLNVQGDEPFVELSDLSALALKMTREQARMGTLIHRNVHLAEYQNPNCVKALIDQEGRALYFSRAGIPYFRPPAEFDFFWQHVGVYAFQRQTLFDFCRLPPHRLEEVESLEQLRALGHGIPIVTAEAQHASLGIDTPQDLEAARARFH